MGRHVNCSSGDGIFLLCHSVSSSLGTECLGLRLSKADFPASRTVPSTPSPGTEAGSTSGLPRGSRLLPFGRRGRIKSVQGCWSATQINAVPPCFLLLLLLPLPRLSHGLRVGQEASGSPRGVPGAAVAAVSHQNPRAWLLTAVLQPRGRFGIISLTLLSRGDGSSEGEQSQHSPAPASPHSRLSSGSSPGVTGTAGLGVCWSSSSSCLRSWPDPLASRGLVRRHL